MADITSPFAAALTLLWAPTGLIIAAYLGLLQFKVGRQPGHSAVLMTLFCCQRAAAHADHKNYCSQTFYALFATLAARRRGGMLWRKVQPCEHAALVTLFTEPAWLQTLSRASIAHAVSCLTSACARSPGQIQLQPRKHFRVRTCSRPRREYLTHSVPLIIMLPSAHIRQAAASICRHYHDRQTTAECRRSPQKFTPSVTHVVLVRA